MLKFIAFRLVRLAATLLAVSILTFFMVDLLPGDPINAILPPTAPRDAETVARITEEFNLDAPVYERYFSWLGNALQGDLGYSYFGSERVTDIIKSRIPVTAELAFLAVGMAVLLAIPIGVLGAYKQGSKVDQLSSAGVQISLSIAPFISGIFLIWLLSVRFNVLPSTGWNRIGEHGLWENLKTAIMPATALALAQMAFFSRLVRADMINTLQENFILSAKAKGLKDRYILFRHALRPSSLSLITIVGLNFGALLGGTVVIEQLFALPGLGKRLLEAIFKLDIVVIQGIVVFIASAYVIVNTIVDLIYGIVDPRIRKG